MGHINVAPTSLGNPAEWEAEQTVDSILKVLIHEAMHVRFLHARRLACVALSRNCLLAGQVLGFTYEKIQQFPCPDKPSFDRFEPGSAGGVYHHAFPVHFNAPIRYRERHFLHLGCSHTQL